MTIQAIELALRGEFLGEDLVSQAVAYALQSGGKRIRPQIVLSVAEALGKTFPVMDAALAVEFFHTASLIADDLPCMDNDPIRRGKEAVHTIFGVTVALLASYALISEAFKKIEENGRKMTKVSPFGFEATTICLEQASRSSGIRGAVLGQYYDLFGGGKSIEETIYLKTGTLFEGAFVLGWVFGGGDFSYLEKVRRVAIHFGMAFQMQDDLADLTQDEAREGFNVVTLMGRDLAEERFESELHSGLALLKDLPIEIEVLTPLLARVFPASLLQTSLGGL